MSKYYLVRNELTFWSDWYSTKAEAKYAGKKNREKAKKSALFEAEFLDKLDWVKVVQIPNNRRDFIAWLNDNWSS